MTIAGYAALVALWIEAEQGPGRPARPHDLRTPRTLYGLSLAGQGQRTMESRAGFRERRSALRARHLEGRPLAPEAQAELDLWEVEFDRDLARTPVLLVPPHPEMCEADRVDRIVGEVEALVGGR